MEAFSNVKSFAEEFVTRFQNDAAFRNLFLGVAAGLAAGFKVGLLAHDIFPDPCEDCVSKVLLSVWK